MCTVVVRWVPGEPVQVLALRDELEGRRFQDPGAWWPDQPQAIGGRDEVAGGSWAVTDVASAVTALVLNRPERRVADPLAPSRGVLPLLAAARGQGWPENIDLTGMASFTVVLAAPDALTMWAFDGAVLTCTDLAPGTHMVTSGGAEDGKADRYLPQLIAARDSWVSLVQQQEPADDPAALVVRHVDGDRVFATVFGQLITATPGRLVLSYSRQPWSARPWTESEFSAPVT
ncbi:MAG: hypothetical protein JWO12_3439 [Frankiales bacterium]|nr:hypothetical protein [Frankiales bacterium]